MLISAQELRNMLHEICVHRMDADLAHASLVAEQLVDGNLSGHDSHGAGLIPTYVDNYQRGHLHANADVSVIESRGPILRLDGNLGFGQVVGTQAMDLGIERCKEMGVVVIALRNAHHLGRIGAYGEQCSRAELVSVHFANAVGHPPRVAPFGGTKARLATNPFCCSMPVPGESPFVLDMATSSIAAGKVRVAMNRGKEVPEGCLLDADGNPTTDPRALFTDPLGVLTHFGGHKGYGIALVCELLGGALASHWTIQPEHEQVGTNVGNMLSILLDPAAFGDARTFEHEVKAVLDYVRSSPTMRETNAVLIPGEPEQHARRARLEHGIEIKDAMWGQLSALSKTSEAAPLNTI